MVEISVEKHDIVIEKIKNYVMSSTLKINVVYCVGSGRL